jgi:hypothetical protein
MPYYNFRSQTEQEMLKRTGVGVIDGVPRRLA